MSFGDSVSLDRGIAVMGGLQYSDLSGLGTAYVFDIFSNTPTLPLMALTNPNGSPVDQDYFGISVASHAGRAFVGAANDDTQNIDQGALYIYDSEQVTVLPDELAILSGVQRAGDISSIELSDNEKLSISRNSSQVASVVELELHGRNVIDQPGSMQIVLESKVFARGVVEQQIELYDYQSASWEVVDTRNASRLDDHVVEVFASGDVSRFVQPRSGRVSARIRFRSSSNRSQFSALIDQVKWRVRRFND